MGWGIRMREEGLAEGREEGFAEGRREVVVRLGTRRFGAPDAETLQWLETLDAEGLSAAVDRLLEADSWRALRG